MASSERVTSPQRTNKDLHFGTRKSAKWVRCYKKPELGVFRVELELHSDFLRNHQITTLADLTALPSAVYPRHARFVTVSWARLERYLKRAKGAEGQAILAGAKERAASVHQVCRYLKRHGVSNPHRFLMPMRLNRMLIAALHRWERKFTLEV